LRLQVVVVAGVVVDSFIGKKEEEQMVNVAVLCVWLL
jgi:hypothetical protein